MPSSHLILCGPLLLLPPIPPSIRVFSNESTLRRRWPKCWSFSFSLSPSNEHAGLISFRMDWLDLLAVQGTLKSLLQHHSSKASILQCSALYYCAIVLLLYSSPDFEPVSCSTSDSNCCFLTHKQVTKEIGKVVWYSFLLKDSHLGHHRAWTRAPCAI